MKKEFLNPNICKDLRNAVNETDIFIKDDVERQHFNLICAVMDRIDSCISFINLHSETPKTEEDLIIFMTFSDILVNAVQSVLKELKIPYDKKTKNYFKAVCMGKPFNLGEVACPPDDRFFAYFRSLVFAHPFETDRHEWAKRHDDEIQYSPYVLVRDHLFDIKDAVGVRIYSNKSIEDLGESVLFSFTILKDYIGAKYKLLASATNKVLDIIKTKESIWKERKVDRTLTPVDILKDVVDILDERYIDKSHIEELIDYLECETTIDANDKLVKEFRELVIAIIQNICDGVDNMDYETYLDTISNLIDARPKRAHQMLHYQLEKIYCYLNYEYGDTDWGLIQAEAFSKEFAKKWVKIKPYEMSFEEIKLLTTVACYFETQEQLK